MKKWLMVSIFLTSCGTYVPVEYYIANDFRSQKNSLLNITIADIPEMLPEKKLALKEYLRNEINRDGWWKFENTIAKKNYEIIISNYNVSDNLISSSTEKVDNKIFRTSSYKFYGTAEFGIRKPEETITTNFSVHVDGVVTSTQEVPAPHGAKSIAPLFEAALGIDRQKDMIKNQDMFLSIDSYIEANKKLVQAIIIKITPTKRIANLKIDDDNNDMDTLISFLREKDFNSSEKYLILLSKDKKRSDVIYNLGILQEHKGNFVEACPLYQEAFQLFPKKLYLEQKISCESRLENFKKIVNE